MTPPTLDVKLAQLQLMSAPAWLASWGQDHPEQRAAVQAALEALVDHELARRHERAITARIQAAKFVQVQTVDRFDFEYNASTRKLRSRYLNLLATDLVAEGIGALFISDPGLGKTHLARALGYAQCQRGHRVLFTTLPALVNRLSAAEATKSLHHALKTFQTPGVLLIDEVGYVALRQPESHLLFQVISLRHDRKKPTVIYVIWNKFWLEGGRGVSSPGSSGVEGIWRRNPWRWIAWGSGTQRRWPPAGRWWRTAPRPSPGSGSRPIWAWPPGRSRPMGAGWLIT
jgi:DNA replication protein DnaC